jgi:hypothetical protein
VEETSPSEQLKELIEAVLAEILIKLPEEQREQWVKNRKEWWEHQFDRVFTQIKATERKASTAAK